jgi:hypothetical protein
MKNISCNASKTAAAIDISTASIMYGRDNVKSFGLIERNICNKLYR